METQVLIPQELSLVLTASGAKKSREQVATVFATARIPQGMAFYPFQGTVRTDKLEIHSYLDENDVSWATCPSKQVQTRHLTVINGKDDHSKVINDSKIYSPSCEDINAPSHDDLWEKCFPSNVF